MTESVMIDFDMAEALKFEAYQGCCLVGELCSFLSLNGFRERGRHGFRHFPGIGPYFDIVFERSK